MKDRKRNKGEFKKKGEKEKKTQKQFQNKTKHDRDPLSVFNKNSNIKERKKWGRPPHPWNTQYQFLMKSLPSKPPDKCRPHPSPGQYPGQIQGSIGLLKIKSSSWVAMKGLLARGCRPAHRHCGLFLPAGRLLVSFFPKPDVSDVWFQMVSHRRSISDRTSAPGVLCRHPFWKRTSPTRRRQISKKIECPISDRTWKFDFENRRRPIFKKSGGTRGKEGWLQSMGTLVHPLWRLAGSGAKAPPLAARPVGNGPGQFLGSYVIGRVHTTCFVQWLSWVFKTKEINFEESKKGIWVSLISLAWVSLPQVF